MCASNPNLPQVSLQCFGSFQSGFASAGSDMDLAIVVQDPSSAAACFSMMEEDLPRSLEMELLQKGIGARLLTRTRVPIIKVCENPGPDLLEKLFEEREKWAALPEEEKYPHLHKEDVTAENPAQQGIENAVGQAVPVSGAGPDQATAVNASKQIDAGNNGQAAQFRPKTWTRERKAGPLDFPKDGVGIQCDINFFNPLGLHNTQMLRCYAKCDPRVRPMVLFVKSWAKQRKINSSYSGTLSSYGYVMMVLHYLINIVQPPVLPNLQMPWRPRGIYAPPGSTKAEVDGWVVDFWANEDEIEAALRSGQMSSNADSLGSLLAGFFQYYSSMGYGPQFRWTQQVLSLRTPGGILTKDEKGWVKALTEEGDGRKIQHRYLFCIEDPFELSHNVARTVTHNGIVAIRDEFRRAQRILSLAGNGVPSKEGDLFDKLIEVEHPGPPHAQGEPTVPVERSSGPGLPSQQTHSQGPASPTVQQKEKPPSSTSPDGATSSAEAGQLGSAYQEAYPTLGTANSDSKRNKNINGPVKRANFNEISGDKAQAILEEFRRKKAEAQAESTAFGAAEAVLSGID
jgi:terminal uridylyltransferase